MPWSREKLHMRFQSSCVRCPHQSTPKIQQPSEIADTSRFVLPNVRRSIATMIEAVARVSSPRNARWVRFAHGRKWLTHVNWRKLRSTGVNREAVVWRHGFQPVLATGTTGTDQQPV